MNTTGEIVQAAHSFLRAPRLALASYVRTEGADDMGGWFRSVLDRESRVAFMANSERGSTDFFLTVSLGDREYIAVPDGGSTRTWMVRDVDAGEQPDTGADGVLWLLGAFGQPVQCSDGSLAVALDRKRASSVADDSVWADGVLSGHPDRVQARVWSSNGVIEKFLLDFPASNRPRRPGSQRLVQLASGSAIPRLELDAAEGEAGVDRLVTELLASWPTGDLVSSVPPELG